MKSKLILLVASLLLLSGCNAGNKKMPEARQLGDDAYYALFMYNYPRVTIETPNGDPAKVENLLFEKKEIQIGVPFTKPMTDPERKNYEFQGWFKEKSCLNEWVFETDLPIGSTLLYAKWGVSQAEEYVEPEYVVPEKIITDANYRVTGILNQPINDAGVNLGTGAINRLAAHADDVSFAVNYERKENVTLTSATYNVDTKVINLEVSSGETFTIPVNDISEQLTMANEQPYPESFESKASNYDSKADEKENYHVMLAGSSSMENWDTSTEDMNPIVSYNHGIGGTTVTQWTNKLLDRLITPYSPKIVVYYVGVNDIINSNNTGAATANNLKALFNKTHQRLPNAHVFYVLINKLPGYPNSQADFDVANNAAIEFSNSNDWLTCVDAGKGLLKDNGEPHYAYFRPDGLHMSRYGYVIWGGAVKQAIMDYLG